MTGWRIAFEAGPWEAGLALAALAAAFASRRWMEGLPGRVRALRTGAWLALALLLAKPVLHRLEARSVLPRLAVVVDASPSMAAPDDEKAPRAARAARWLLSRRAALESRAEVSLYSGAAGARRLSWEELSALEAGRAAMDLPLALGDAAAAAPAPDRIWLLSDGSFDESSLQEAASRARVPVDVVAVGPRAERPGLALARVESPDFVFLHGRFPLVARVETRMLEGRTVRLRLLRGTVPEGEAVLEAAGPYDVLTATFSVTASQLGRQDFTVVAEAGAMKASRSFAVEAIRQKYRIMYLAGRPSVEYAHLRHQLKADPNHELVSFVILRNPENLSPVPDNELSLIPFPAAEIFVTNLFQFDLFILENFAYWRFSLPPSYLENLRRFVAQGGALLLIGGSNALSKGGYKGTPLEDALPVTLADTPDEFVPGLFPPKVAAPDHPLLSMGSAPEEAAALWKSLPPLDGFTRFNAVRSGASVLLSHPSERTAAGGPLPVVAVREYGKGKVMVVGTDSSWRWKLAGGKDWRVSGFYARFWSRAVQYLTRSLELKKVAFSPLPDRLPSREPLTLTLRVFDEHFRPLSGRDLDLRLSWERPDGSRRAPAAVEREPGEFVVELMDLSEGRQKVSAVARRAGQAWGADSVEFRWEPPRADAPLDRARLKALADAAGGRSADIHRDGPDALAAALPAPRREDAVSSRRTAWTSALWVWTLAAMLLGEWLMRRRGGFL